MFLIKVKDLYWQDYTIYGRWPWTRRQQDASRFEEATAQKIIDYWNRVHHHPDGIKSSATSLGGIIPINAVMERDI